MINKRQLELLELLLIGLKPITGSQLGKFLGVSVRTIRSDILSLNQELKNKKIFVQSQNPYGYFLLESDREMIKSWIVEHSKSAFRKELPQTPSERATYLILRLLYSDSYEVMQNLSETLYVSKSTINNDINRLIDYLESINTGVQIQLNRFGLKIIGKESEKRKAVARFMSLQSNGMNLLYQTMHILQPENVISNQTSELYEKLIGLFEEHQIYLSDQDIQSFIYYLIIGVNRIREKHLVELLNDIEINPLVHQIINILEEIYGIEVVKNEAIYVQELFDSKSMIYTNTIHPESSELNKIIEMFLQQVHEFYDLDFTQNLNLKQFLIVHIRSMINRIKFNTSENNPLKDDIKKKFPLATEISFLLYNILKDEKHLIMNDSEISYIALHIASALEVLITPSLVCLVSELSLSTTRLLATKLMHFFGNKINLTHQITVYQYNKLVKMDLLEVDLVISTMNIMPCRDIPIVKVNPLLFRDDIANIKHFINFFATEVKDKNFFSDLFDERLFFRETKPKGYLNVIQDLVHKLKSFDYIENEQEYYQLVLEREKTYSTIMANCIAIPHALENKARKTVIAVALLDTPTIYDGQEVSIVLLNAINEKENLQTLYTAIERILSIEDINQLKESKTLQQFISEISGK